MVIMVIANLKAKRYTVYSKYRAQLVSLNLPYTIYDIRRFAVLNILVHCIS